MDHGDYAYTYGMDDSAVKDRLRTSQTGVLALSKENDAYAIPVAHSFDGSALYFRLGITDGSKKQAFLQTTETACYVLYDTEPTAEPEELESWSIIITGQLNELPESESDRFEAAVTEPDFTPLRVFDEPIEDIQIAFLEMEIDTITGRATPIG